MKETQVRLGMIGCGAIAELYHLPALQKVLNPAKSVFLAEPNEDRLSAIKRLYPVAGAVQDYRELQGHVDGVIIATPPTTHYEISKWFINRGIDVLCEKPLTESAQQARELVDLADERNVKLAVNQTRRFFPTYQKIRELIESGVLGQLHSITYFDGNDFNWPAASPFHFASEAKGVWSDTGVHLLDTICYWLGDTPELVETQNDSFGGPEAMATVRLRHEQCDVQIKVSRLGKFFNGFKIIGSLGTIEAETEEFAEVRVSFKSGGRKIYKCGSRKLKYLDFAKPLIENFVDVVSRRAEPVVSGADTLGTIELLEKAYEKPTNWRMRWNELVEPMVSHFHPGDQPQPRRVLVTGASGFVGGRVVELLKLSDLAQPVAAVRSWSRAARAARFGVDFVVCDICDPDQVDAAVAGVDAIVHCAKTDARESIVGGTRNLLEAAVKYGVERFVLLSSAEVYGGDVKGDVTENSPTNKTGNLYGDAKIEAEEICREFHPRGIEPTILRPSLIYGPFSGSWTIQVARRLFSGKWGLFDGNADGNANFVYVDDLFQSIWLSLVNRKARGQAFNVNGPDIPTWNEYFMELNRMLGLPPLKHISATKSRLRTKVMDSLAYVKSKAVERYEDRLMEIYLQGGWASRIMKSIKGQLDNTPTGGELNNLYARRSIYLDNKIRDSLGYAPAFDLSTGIALSVIWLHHHEIAVEPFGTRSALAQQIAEEMGLVGNEEKLVTIQEDTAS